MFAAIAAGTIGSALIGANSASKAAKAQASAADAATAEERRQYEQSREDLAPYRQSGSAAMGRISDLLGLEDSRILLGKPVSFNEFAQTKALNPDWFPGMSVEQAYESLEPARKRTEDFGSLNKKFTVQDFWKDPVTALGFDFGLGEGTKAIDRGAGALGLRNSGSTLKALTKWGQDYAGSKAGESASRFYGDQDRTFNRLMGVTGGGQTATTNTASLGAQSAGRVGDLMVGAGNARGAASIGRGNAWSNAIGNVGNLWMGNEMLKRFPVRA